MATIGNPSNVNYHMAAVLADYISYQYTASVTDESGPLTIRAETVDGVDTLTEFEVYVPPLLGLSLMMLIWIMKIIVIFLKKMFKTTINIFLHYKININNKLSKNTIKCVMEIWIM